MLFNSCTICVIPESQLDVFELATPASRWRELCSPRAGVVKRDRQAPTPSGNPFNPLRIPAHSLSSVSRALPPADGGGVGCDVIFSFGNAFCSCGENCSFEERRGRHALDSTMCMYAGTKLPLRWRLVGLVKAAARGPCALPLSEEASALKSTLLDYIIEERTAAFAQNLSVQRAQLTTPTRTPGYLVLLPSPPSRALIPSKTTASWDQVTHTSRSE